MDNVKAFHEKHLKFDKCVMGVWEALEYLDKIVDQSDPDTEASQVGICYMLYEIYHLKNDPDPTRSSIGGSG